LLDTLTNASVHLLGTVSFLTLDFFARCVSNVDHVLAFRFIAEQQ